MYLTDVCNVDVINRLTDTAVSIATQLKLLFTLDAAVNASLVRSKGSFTHWLIPRGEYLGHKL